MRAATAAPPRTHLRILSPSLDPDGYAQVRLQDNESKSGGRHLRGLFQRTKRLPMFPRAQLGVLPASAGRAHHLRQQR